MFLLEDVRKDVCSRICKTERSRLVRLPRKNMKCDQVFLVPRHMIYSVFSKCIIGNSVCTNRS